MAAITSGCTLTELVPSLGGKLLMVETANTADTGDTIAIDLNDDGRGGTVFQGVLGFVHTTENSVVVAEAPTTSVTGTTLTITVGGSAVSDKKRVYYVFYR